MKRLHENYILKSVPNRICVKQDFRHLVKFTLPTGISGYNYPMSAISLKTPGLSITFDTLSACRSFEAKDY